MTTYFSSLAGILIVPALLLSANSADAQRPSLGAAESFAVLGASTVSSVGMTTVTGRLGVAPGSSITGFPPGVVVGSIHAGNALALQAQDDLTAAYGLLAGAPCTSVLTGTDLGGLTLTPGVYCFAGSAPMNGVLTLDAQGNSAAVFIFQIGSTLLVELGSSVQLTNSAGADNIFWQIGSSATLASNVDFEGNLVALASITLSAGATLQGRALARTAAVSMDASVVSIPRVTNPAGEEFIRGDVNASSTIGILDPILVLTRIFLGGAPLACFDAGDFNDDGVLGIVDAIGLLSYLFVSGPVPANPFPLCGLDPTPLDPLDCALGVSCP